MTQGDPCVVADYVDGLASGTRTTTDFRPASGVTVNIGDASASYTGVSDSGVSAIVFYDFVNSEELYRGSQITQNAEGLVATAEGGNGGDRDHVDAVITNDVGLRIVFNNNGSVSGDFTAVASGIEIMN